MSELFDELEIFNNPNWKDYLKKRNMEEVQWEGNPQRTEENQSNQNIKDLENKYPEISEEFKKIQEEQYRLFATKMLDYGPNNISLGADLSNPENKRMSLTGIWIRTMDKMNRLRNLVVLNNSPKVNNESVEDTYDDFANYSIIAKIVMRDKWKIN